MANVKAIAKEWAPRVGISETEVISYLVRNISYSLPPETVAGLNLFFQLSEQFGIIAKLRELSFVAEIPAAAKIT